jgi:hypothetical protein
MVGAAGFMALCILAATPEGSTVKDSHLKWGTTQPTSYLQSPLPEEKAEEKTQEGWKRPSRLPKTLPDDPGYQAEKKTLEPTQEGDKTEKPSTDKAAPPAEETRSPQGTPIFQNEEEESACIDPSTCDPYGEACSPGVRSGWRGWCDGISTESWLDQGATLNTLSPRNRINGPVVYNDRSNDYQLNQFYFRLKRDVDSESDAWDLGGRVDMLYGTDSIYTTARGLEVNDDLSPKWNAQRYGLAMPQAYMEVYAPWGNGISMKLGHFYSILGYESVPATGNFFYSHSYVSQYGEPQTFTGLLGETTLGDFTLQAGMVRGWNNWDDNNNDLGFTGGIHWKSESERTKMSFCVYAGREQPDESSNVRMNYSLVFEEQISENWQYVIQHDYGSEPGAGVHGSVANWYGIDQYLFYKISDCWKAGMRFEWFCDLNGARVPGDTQTADYFEWSTGLNWTPNERVMVRPEIRWDWTGTPNFYPFGDGARSNQVLLDCDVVVRF